MPGSTGAPYDLPYPVGTEQPFAHLDMKALAEQVHANLGTVDDRIDTVGVTAPAADGTGVIKVVPGVLHMGVTSGSTNASGEIVTPHGLPATPRIVLATPLFVTDAILNLLQWSAVKDAANVKVIMIRSDTGARFAGQPVPCCWLALK